MQPLLTVVQHPCPGELHHNPKCLAYYLFCERWVLECYADPSGRDIPVTGRAIERNLKAKSDLGFSYRFDFAGRENLVPFRWLTRSLIPNFTLFHVACT